MSDDCENPVQTGIINHDSAGDTSQRCDKAPAHASSAPRILTSEQLLDRLSAKGIGAEGATEARALLESLGYTHVARYVPTHLSIVEGPSFATLYRDVMLDHAFQAALLARIIEFERSFKTHLGNALAREFGEFAHLEREAFKDERAWRRFVDGSRSELVQKARRGSRYAARIASLGRRIPVWYALEFSSLGNASKLYANLVSCGTKREVATHYGLDTSFVESWLASISFVRNECAHGGVLYGRELEVQPRSHRLFPDVSNRRAFYQPLMLCWLLERDLPGRGEVVLEAVAPILSADSVRVALGTPDDWESRLADAARLARGFGEQQQDSSAWNNLFG